MQSSIAQRIALAFFVTISIWFSFYIIQPPEPKPVETKPTEFSAERAYTHVQQIARQPHPLGSTDNERVRQYIIDELENLGLSPIIQKGIGVSGRFGSGLAGYPRNIVAKLEGTNPKNAILLMTHYDTAPNAPGAADDASGVSAILESVRALKAQKSSLKNDVWILITDGEERGLLGAELFVDQFTELNQIDLVLNFEARGTSGPSMMFETSSPNASLIPHFARATPYPVANSLMYTVYKLLPNDTDMSVTKRAGLKGLNFAFTNDYLNYHTMQDSPQNLSMASLQHHGSNLLSNIRHFSDTSFSLDGTSELVYFNSAGGGLAYYPASWSLPLAAVAAILFIAYLIYLFRTNRLTLGSYLGSILLFLGIITAGAGLTFAGWQGIKLLHPEYQWLYHGEVYTHHWYLWGFLCIVISLFTGIYGWVRSKYLSPQQLLAGSLTIWMLLSLGTAWYLPTASYIFTWPALMALLGWIVLGDRLVESSSKSAALLAVSLFALFFLFSPYIYLVQIMLTTEMLAVSMCLTLLVLGLSWPLIERIVHPQTGILSSGFVAIGLTCLLAASLSFEYDSNHKKQNDISYVHNLDEGQAYWISRDHTTDRWTQQFLTDSPNQGTPPLINAFQSGSYLYHKAALAEQPHPTIDLLADSSSGSLRYVELQIHSPKPAIAMHLRWESPASIIRLHMDGKAIVDHTKRGARQSIPRTISLFKDMSDSTSVRFAVAEGSSIPTLGITFMRMGLPTQLIANYRPREPNMMPKAHWHSNSTFWQVSVDPDTLQSQ